DPEQRARDVALLDAAVRAHDQRGRVAGAGEHDLQTVTAAREPPQQRAREARVARLLLLEHYPVDDLHGGARAVVLRRGAQGVADDARHSRRARVLALDVAER